MVGLCEGDPEFLVLQLPSVGSLQGLIPLSLRGPLLLTTGHLLCSRNYEQIVKAHQDNPNEGKNQVSDEVKFNVFQGIMDSLFQSFNASISVTSFQELSACVFSWIEEHCKPQVSAGGAAGASPGAVPLLEDLTLSHVSPCPRRCRTS